MIKLATFCNYWQQHVLLTSCNSVERASVVHNEQEKMNNREKLHEIQYPPKHGRGEPPPVVTPSPMMLKIQAPVGHGRATRDPKGTL